MGGPPQVWSPVVDHQTPCMFIFSIDCFSSTLYLMAFYWGYLRDRFIFQGQKKGTDLFSGRS
ncbi:hypothetical protein CKO25_20540 [Thiocapsa imhoffii]|uniref:Uncharacterized protein n=1 Tax=Thiocapsa imhoffii TaxID=382777 RepID=A0A9X0WMB6_9GAMM|nr:hypothetical protein [Thiocapsa imhoffii]